MPDWTAERIAGLPIESVKTLRENAVRHGDSTVVALCDAAIASRAPVSNQTPRVKLSPKSRQKQIVIGFHFVCPREKGVTINPDGTIWTGTWVVDKIHAERGSKLGAYVALHTAKSEPSYLQGIVKEWRKTSREREYAEGRPVKIEFGIDFLLEPTDQPYTWNGDGAGEKGYVWGKPEEMAGTNPAMT